jgi:hypothetical protein
LVIKHDGKKKKRLGRPVFRWHDNIKIYLQYVSKVYLVQDRDKCLALVNEVMKLRVP